MPKQIHSGLSERNAKLSLMLHDGKLMLDDSHGCNCRVQEMNDDACPEEHLHTAAVLRGNARDNSMIAAGRQNGGHDMPSFASQMPNDALDSGDDTAGPLTRKSTGQSLVASSQYNEPLDDRTWQCEAYALDDAHPQSHSADQMPFRGTTPSEPHPDACAAQQQQQQQVWHRFDASDGCGDDQAQHPSDDREQQGPCNADSQTFLRKTSRKQNMWRLPDYSLVKPRTNCHLEPHFKPAGLTG